MTDCSNDYFVICVAIIGIVSVLFTGVVAHPILAVSASLGLIALGSVRTIILKKRIAQLEKTS